MKWMKTFLSSALFIAMLLGSALSAHASSEVPLRAVIPVNPKPVEILAAPNDSLYPKQSYLKQIHAEDAWNSITEAQDTVIALIDTGVDLNHPDLKDNLVPGTNLIDPSQPPMDDNGHGTNVAGVIAAAGNNARGVSGVLWRTRIMPIKALDANGRGDEEKLAEAIRYAVDHGAKIIELSVGLLSDNPSLNEVVAYAESQGVLLIAASGNDEGNVVRYPAAYPTVLAVGGIAPGNKIEDRSNYGPEIDLVAPWSVYTTARGGRYETKEGTSMAAPQVAAVAAMVWEKHPEMKPSEVRNLLRQTAQDVGAKGWDPYTGYGLLRADRAVTLPYKTDMFEPNDSKQAAKPFSINRMLSASFDGGADADWFYTDADYDGTLELTVAMDDVPEQGVSLIVETGDNRPPVRLQPEPGEPVYVPVTKGRTWIELTLNDSGSSGVYPYTLTSGFEIYRDPFEDNDKPYKAYVLPARDQSVVGTFDQPGDEDWFQLNIEQSGTLELRMEADSDRIDGVLYIQRKGEKPVIYDQRGAGETEVSPKMDVLPGTYYIRLTKTPDTPAVGEYTLHVRFSEKLVDPNEPNDKSYQATMAALDYEYGSVFDYDQDSDWFQFQIDEDSLVDITLKDIPENRTLALVLMNSGLTRLETLANRYDEAEIEYKGKLTAGTYYIRLNTDEAFTNQMVHLNIHADPLVAGFADLQDHWSRDAVVSLIESGILEGDGGIRFRPDDPLTRAEAVAMIDRAFQLTKSDPVTFPDLSDQDWAYPYVGAALHAKIVSGYPDGTFRPDQPVTRMEMTAMLARALGIEGKQRGSVPFTDVRDSDWGAGILKQMKAEGWIDGFQDGTFRPSALATRGEFASLLKRAVE